MNERNVGEFKGLTDVPAGRRPAPSSAKLQQGISPFLSSGIFAGSVFNFSAADVEKSGKRRVGGIFLSFFQSGIRRQAVRSRREAVGKINAGNSEPAISRQRHFASGLTPKNKVLHLTSKAYVRPHQQKPTPSQHLAAAAQERRH
ncbi:hypothetical protein LSTR_LSTR015562 [Laodelphax striatellus]|uniref:Uncharacterized protein n=1 Tax=Laodelphax striatellus TaxID=195883 RepID=A0A482X0D6_LAOST|nr:hypothetical protein LSTR_LSTR015562 [Laodelphax striatellus]